MTSTLADLHLSPLRLVAEVKASQLSELPLLDLTRRMRQGSDEAWDEFHRRYYVGLLRYAGSRVPRQEEPGEIVQQAYLRIARHIKPFADETDFWRWLACVVRTVAVDHQRGVSRRAMVMEKFALWREAQRGASVQPPGFRSADSLTQEALLKLPANDAQLLRLKYCEGWSIDQLAAEECTTPKTIENRIARLRQRVREIVSRMQ